MGHSEKMEQEDDRPKWLTELENRKRKPRLAHEVGAGAPCMKCSASCPGLDLHFWRKICKNCKCSRDDHDVPNDEFPQFDLLFGPSGKANRKMIVLKVNKKQAEAEMTFEWAPPDTTKELAADYMKALPEDKLPIKGTAGAVLRKQQLQRQLPLHDIDHKVCDELSESEKKQFEKYLENLKKYVGQGKVTKAMGARPFDISLMTPANATDMNRFSPKHRPTVPENHHSLNLRTPSSFVQKSTVPSSLSSFEAVNGIRNRGFDSPSRDRSPATMARTEIVRSPALGRSSHENSPQGRYHHALSTVRNDAEVTNSRPIGGSINSPLHFATTNRIADRAYTSLAGRNESIGSPSDTLVLSQNSDIATSGPIGGSYNPAVHFAAANMLTDRQRTCDDERSRGLKYATSNTLNDHDQQLASSADSRLDSSRFPAENLAISSPIPGAYSSKSSVQQPSDRPTRHTSGTDSDLAKNREQVTSSADSRLNSLRFPAENLAISSPVSGTYSPKSSVQQPSDRPSHHSSGTDSDLGKNREIENSLLAERMLNEALLPPSAVHAADIIGSTLDEKGLSFIREKLTSKYSAKDESVNSLQSPTRARELEKRDQLGNGARSRRADQLRRQGAFDKETERSDVVAAMRNPSGNRISDEDFSALHCGESSHSALSVDDLNGTRHSDSEMLGDSGCLRGGLCGSKDNNSNGFGALKGVSGNEPWMQIYRGICDNFLTNRPGQGHQSQVGVQQDDNNSSSEKGTSGGCSINSEKKSLRAELTSYGTGSDIVRSEALRNPSFPEEAVVSSGIVQNPVSVDRLRGAMEELSLAHARTQNCHKCQEGIHAGDVVVTAEKANDSVWHPGCFVCSVCDELLADLVYFYYKGKLYCGRDLATLLEIPRCFACDELIFVREYTVAEGHNYHVKHFCCWDCDVPLAGQQYISENDRPLCLPCYQRTYAKTCRTCEAVIAADQQGVAIKNLNFHATDECFCCATCKKSLLNGKMGIKEDRPFCSKECITKFLNERTS